LKNTLKLTLDSQAIGTIVAIVDAIQNVISNAKPKKQIIESFMDTLLSLLKLKDEELKENVAIKIGIIAPFLDDKFESFVSDLISSTDPVNSLVIGSICKNYPNVKELKGIEKYIMNQMKSDNNFRKYALKTCGAYLKQNFSSTLLSFLLQFIENEKIGEMKFEAMRVMKNISKKQPGSANFFICVPIILKFIKDKNTSLRGMACRCLAHLLDLNTGGYTMQQYGKSIDSTEYTKLEEITQKLIENYEPSDDEKDDF